MNLSGEITFMASALINSSNPYSKLHSNRILLKDSTKGLILIKFKNKLKFWWILIKFIFQIF